MATKNIVPRATGEGGIGTSVKRWLCGFFNSLDVANGTNAPVNTLQRSTAYALNDVAFYSGIDAKYFLKCTTAGTTGSTVPSFTGVTSGSTVTDGTVVWTVKTLGSEEQLDDYLPLTGGTLTGVVNGVTPTAGDDTTKLATTAYVQKEIRQHGNLPVGHEYFSMNPNVPQGSLPLLGGVYSRETYADLWAWVQEQTGYLKTEAEWQTLSTANNGNVPFYSSGDGSTTFRVPSLHCWIKGSDGSAQLVGSYLQAGLPNITGDFVMHGTGTVVSVVDGAFSGELKPTYMFGTETAGYTSYGLTNFDASRSNSVYGNANTVQPESIVGMWLVKAYGTIVDTGQIDEQAYIDDRYNASKQYTDTQVNAVKSIQLAGLKFYTWRGNLTSDAQANIQGQAPLDTIPFPSQGLRMFTVNIVNAGANTYFPTFPYVYNNDHWIFSLFSNLGANTAPLPVSNYTAEFVLTWAVEE